MSSEWKEFVLGQSCSKIGSGATPTGGKETYLPEGDITLIRSQNVLDFEFSLDGLAYINQEQAKKLSNVELEKDDVLINITGDSVARVCKVPDELLPARVNQHVAILRTDKEKLDSEFLKYSLLLPSNKSLLLAIASAGATRNALTKVMLETFRIRAPKDIVDQNNLANVLKQLDLKIAINKKINQTLETISQTLFKSWFVDFDPVKAKIAAKEQGQDPQLAAMVAISGKSAEQIAQLPEDKRKELTSTADLFPDEMVESELGMIPKGWKVSNFGHVINCFDSKRIPLSNREREKIKGSYPYYGATSIVDYIDKYIFDGTYLLLGEDGSVIKDSGLPFTQFVWGKFWVNNHAHVLQGKNGISTEQLYIFISQTRISEYITGAVQLKLNQGNMNRIPFILANKDINDSFGNIINPHMSMSKTLFEQNKRLSELRDTLLPKLLSGEIEIQ